MSLFKSYNLNKEDFIDHTTDNQGKFKGEYLEDYLKQNILLLLMI